MKKAAQVSEQDLIETAKLRLAFLKENRHYQKAYQSLKKKEIRNPYKDWLDNHLSDSEYKTWHIACELWKKFIDPAYEIPFVLMFSKGQIAEKDLLTIIDPSLNINKLPQSVIKKLPSIFHTNAIKIVQTCQNDKILNGTIVKENLTSFERLVAIDIKKKKSEIMADISYYIDYMQKKAPKTRDRIKESWVQIEVWQLWIAGQNFKQIARRVDITYDGVRMAFRKAYEKIYKRKYDARDIFENKLRKIEKPNVETFKENCPQKPCSGCKAPCNEYLELIEAYVSEGYLPAREKCISEINLPQDSDSFAFLAEQARKKNILPF